MFENVKQFFKDDTKGDMGDAVAAIGKNILHLIKFAFLAYSAVHGISASMSYAGASEWQRAFQVVGIIINEFVLLGIYMKAINGKIEGAPQVITAGITYAVGFTFACLGIVADSQLNAGMALSSFMLAYLHWGLPISPAIAALGGFAIDMTEPEKIQARKEGSLERKIREEENLFAMAMRRADMADRKMQAGIQLDARQVVTSTPTNAAIIDINGERQPATTHAPLTGQQVAVMASQRKSASSGPQRAEDFT